MKHLESQLTLVLKPVYSHYGHKTSLTNLRQTVSSIPLTENGDYMLPKSYKKGTSSERTLSPRHLYSKNNQACSSQPIRQNSNNTSNNSPVHAPVTKTSSFDDEHNECYSEDEVTRNLYSYDTTPITHFIRCLNKPLLFHNLNSYKAA